MKLQHPEFSWAGLDAAGSDSGSTSRSLVGNVAAGSSSRKGSRAPESSPDAGGREISMTSTIVDVLVVDDDTDATGMLVEVLTNQGYRARAAKNGREGLALVHSRKPDLVLLDVEMPELTGPEMAYTMLLHNKGLEKVPIILCSGVLNLAHVAGQVGTPYFLTKPFTLDAMIRLIHRVLQEKRPPRPLPKKRRRP